MQCYAFFDVDGTVIAKDSFFRLMRWRLKTEPWRTLPLLVLSPVFAATSIFKLDRRYAKSALLWSLTCFKRKKEIVRLLANELPAQLAKDWFVETNSELASLRASGHRICYVSASGQLWLRGLLCRTDAGPKTIIGSRLGMRFWGVVFTSPNCYGEQKIARIQQQLGTQIDWSAAYSDHVADLPLLAACQHRTLVNPKSKHIPQFEKNLPKPFRIVKWHTASDCTENTP
jgi:phosphatidylglycerophosphatase C